eukprot:scaffold9477_cov197-Amphora_coffeaeformis.AAC.12
MLYLGIVLDFDRPLKHILHGKCWGLGIPFVFFVNGNGKLFQEFSRPFRLVRPGGNADLHVATPRSGSSVAVQFS